MSDPGLQVFNNDNGTATLAQVFNALLKGTDTFANLRAFNPQGPSQVYCRGGASLNDGLQGFFYWTLGSVADDNNSNIVIAGSFPAAYWKRSSGAMNFVYNTSSSGQLLSTAGATVQRMNDVFRVGGATINSQDAYPASTLDWLSTLLNSLGPGINALETTTFASLNSTNGVNGGAILGGVESKFLNAGTSAIANQNYIFLNDTLAGPGIQGWGEYTAVYRMVGAAGALYGSEIDTYSQVPTVTPSPNLQGDVVGLQLAAGADVSTGPTAYDSSAAIQIASNPKKFKVGINVLAGSITSGGYAMALPSNTAIQFVNTGPHLSGNIISTATGANDYGLQFTDSGALMTGNSNTTAITYFQTVGGSAVNGLAIANSIAGSPVTLAFTGADGNGNLSLSGKGTGNVTVNALAVTGASAHTGNATFGGTLGVTGAVTLASTLGAGNTTITGTLNTSGAATLASGVVTAGLTVGTTLAVTGASNLTGLVTASNGVNIPTGKTLQINSVALLAGQAAGYGTPTGGSHQASFAAGSITLANLAAAVAQLIIDLKAGNMPAT